MTTENAHKESQNIKELLEEDIKENMSVSSIDQSLIDGIPYAICWKDLNHIIVGCNERFCEMIDKSIENVIGNDCSYIFDQEGTNQLNKVSKQVINEQKEMHFFIDLYGNKEFEVFESPFNSKKNKLNGTVMTIKPKAPTVDVEMKKRIIESIESVAEHVKKMKQIL